MDPILAAICGVLYFLGKSKIGYHLTTAVGSPIVMGLVMGAYLGDVATGLVIGASIQLIYLGVINTGGNEPSDPELAAVVAIPVAINTGLDGAAAVAIAVPFGVLGTFLDQLRRTSNSIWVRRADACSEKGDDKGIFHCAYTFPALTAFVIRFVPAFAITLFGSTAIEQILAFLPDWVITGFSVAGGILPAMGFAIIIITIGKPKLLPYFFVGFFAVGYLGISTMAAAVFGLCIALISFFSSADRQGIDLGGMMGSSAADGQADSASPAKDDNALTAKDLRRVYNRWYFSTELSNSYDRLQGLAFCNALVPALKKCYAGDEEGYRKALMRHMEFYNSEGTVGCVIHGISLSMEEENARDHNVPSSVITGIKTGLMGPMAGIGDTLVWGTIKPIILGLACTFALQANSLGAAIPFLFPLIGYFLGWFFLRFGHRLGKDAVMRLMKTGAMNTVIVAASTMGLFMMGALSSSYVKVSTPLQFTMENANPIVIQDILDQILVGFLPLCAIFGVYWYFTHKGANYTKVIIWILVISMICGFFGILG